MSAKSSMSIFSSWLAAPYSAVITYSDRSARSTISVSLCPMPAVSTTTRSKPTARYSAMTSASTALVARCWRRVASERMQTCAAATREQRDGACDGTRIVERWQAGRGGIRPALPDAREHVLDHAGEAERAPILGRVDLGHAVGLERGDLRGRDGAAAADHHAYV